MHCFEGLGEFGGATTAAVMMQNLRFALVIKEVTNLRQAPANLQHKKSVKSGKMAQWASLPWEIQEHILGDLFTSSRPRSINNGGPVGRPLDKSPVCLEYLTTCKSWKYILEPLIYERLYLKSSTLCVLQRLSSAHRLLVRYIWLAVELADNNCARCTGNQLLEDNSDLNSALVQTSLWKLFDLLGKWGDSSPAFDLTLELSLFSKSDMDHCFRNDLHFGTCPLTRYGELEVSRPRLHDKIHGWENGNRRYRLSPETIDQISDSLPKDLSSDLELQPAPAIQKLIIRRQTRRLIVFEPWRSKYYFPTRRTYLMDPFYCDLILENIPKSMKHVTFFEDFNDDYSRIYEHEQIFYDMPFRAERQRTPSRSIPAAFATRSTNLEGLSVSYWIDAYDFFSSGVKCTWPTLSSLFLTSRRLVPETDSAQINAILTAAGNSALRMPRLKTLVIWYGAKGVASEFRYELLGGRASVQWRGTFHIALEPRTLEAWKAAALLHTDRDLIARESLLLPCDRSQLGDLFTRPSGTTAAIAGAATASLCLGVYLRVRPALVELRPLPVDRHILRARTRDAVSSTEKAEGVADVSPYRTDEFPGGRQVRTAYGTMQVFEWGPRDGEKVVLLHGIGTPCIALGDMAREFVAKGYRVMLFDLFGRGYSDAPADLPYDDRLYTTQILLALSSSPLPWTGPSAFHILGFSLGGAIAASFATYHANLLRSVTLICPGGLVRPAHISWRSRLSYMQGGLFPEWLIQHMARKRLRPSSSNNTSVDIPDNAEDADIDFDEVPVARNTPNSPKVGDVVQWQFDGNDGFVPAYVSTIRNAPVYAQHTALWPLLSKELAARRTSEATRPAGLETGRICLIVAEKDPIVVATECIDDARIVLGEDGVDAHIVKGGHEIGISRGKEIAGIAIESWTKFRNK
ncbi:hypothetical protein NLG97_g4916 [Lecanicillium saksenae]|uniref:Uncharacterized protein n=1 Tax=Lecanicillium saksenae TaxID=468837 RepID=A0ACC1QWH5_9HYPO|nr:hypothetical protein NLG97_g4916 [Lecanicillium saksenae]